MSTARRAVTSAVTALLVGHVVVTAFENLPDNTLSLGMRLPWFKKIPQWRFFAPNPGVEDLYLMYRSRTDGEDPWTPWRELSVRERTPLLAVLWNPGSRTSKALFDTAHQLRVLAGYGSSFEWAVESAGYLLIVDVVRSACVKEGKRGQFQFMIVAAMPGQGKDAIKPIMVSLAEPVTTPEGGRRDEQIQPVRADG